MVENVSLNVLLQQALASHTLTIGNNAVLRRSLPRNDNTHKEGRFSRLALTVVSGYLEYSV